MQQTLRMTWFRQFNRGGASVFSGSLLLPTRQAATSGDESPHPAAVTPEPLPRVRDALRMMGMSRVPSKYELRISYHHLKTAFTAGQAPSGESMRNVDLAYEALMRALSQQQARNARARYPWYYSHVPQWAARNLDEAPKYVQFLRWQCSRRQRGVIALALVSAIVGCVGVLHTRSQSGLRLCLVFAALSAAALVVDYLLHCVTLPFVLLAFVVNATVKCST